MIAPAHTIIRYIVVVYTAVQQQYNLRDLQPVLYVMYRVSDLTRIYGVDYSTGRCLGLGTAPTHNNHVLVIVWSNHCCYRCDFPALGACTAAI